MTTEIKPLGTYFTNTPNGYIINPTSFQLIPDQWLPLINEVKATCIDQFGSDLHSLYLRGSVPRGLASDGFADLDLLVLLSTKNLRWKPAKWLPDYQKSWQKKYPFVKEIEVMCSSYSKNFEQANPPLAMIIKTQSLLLEGTSIDDQIEPFKPDKYMMLNYRWLADDLKLFLSIDNPSMESIQGIAKVVIRSGFELVMERVGKYTVDLYLCCEAFGQFYPERGEQMMKVLFYYLNPSTAEELFQTLISELGNWLIAEIKRLELLT